MIEEIKKKGLVVEGIGEKISIKDPKAIVDPREFSPFDLAVISVKSYSTRYVVESLPEDVAKRVLTFQNGLGNEEILSEKFGAEKVVAGSITYPVSYISAGHVKIEKEKAGMGISPVSKADIDDLIDIFKKGGVTIREYSDYRSLKWSKLLLNIVCNATCAILDMMPKEVFSNLSLVWVEREQVLEALRVMNKKKIRVVDLPGYPVRAMATMYTLFPPILLMGIMKAKVAKGRGDKPPSLLLDLRKGRGKTEVDYLNGAIYREAYSVTLPARVNKIIAETLEDIARGVISWQEYRKKPEAFVKLFKRR